MNGFYLSFCDAVLAGFLTNLVTKPLEKCAINYQVEVWSPNMTNKDKTNVTFREFVREKIRTDGFRSLYYRFGRDMLKTVPRQAFMFGLDQKFRSIFMR